VSRWTTYGRPRVPGVAVAGGLSRGEPDRRGQGTILVYNHNAGGHVPQPLRGNVRGTRRFVGGSVEQMRGQRQTGRNDLPGMGEGVA